MLTQVGQRASHFHSTHSGDLGQPRVDSDMDQMAFWPRLPGEVPGNILCLSGTFCRCPHFSIPPSFLIFFPQRLPNSQPPSPHPSFYLLPPLSPPIYINYTLSLLFLQLFHRNDSLGFAERVGVLSSSLPTISDFSFVDSTPRTSGLPSSSGGCNSNDRL